MPRSVKAMFLLVLDAAVLGFSILLRLLRHALIRLLMNINYGFCLSQSGLWLLRSGLEQFCGGWSNCPHGWGYRADAECFSQSGFTLPDSTSRKRIVYRLVCSWWGDRRMIWVYYSWLMLLKRQPDFIKKFRIWHWLFDGEPWFSLRAVLQYIWNDKAPSSLSLLQIKNIWNT